MKTSKSILVQTTGKPSVILPFILLLLYPTASLTPFLSWVCCRLADLGRHVGFRMIDVLCLREKTPKRETRLVNMLWFIQKTVWKVTV